MAMMDLLKKLCHLRLAPASPDADKAVSILSKELKFKVHQYQSAREHNGWTVPHSWHVEKAEIRKDGKVIYDGAKDPLGVMGYAKSFRGKVSLETLKEHLTYRKDHPDAIGYHCDYFYKPWRSDWGFSVPYSLYMSLEPGQYEIDLRTVFAKGTMKVCDFFLKGEMPDAIVLNAHSCHAAQANDDIAGMVVGIEVMKRLAAKKRKYSYRLVIAPEHLGTVFYLADMPKKAAADLKLCIFLEMLGNKNRLALQHSFNGDSAIDKAAGHYLKFNSPDHFSDKFRKIVGNDETVWEAPGFEIPTISISRWPYSEYHTNLDNEKIISEDMLEDSVRTVLGILDILDTDCVVKRKFDGLVALSNPKYDLYFNQADPSIRSSITADEKKWNYLMDCLPRYFDGKMKILDIAIRQDIEYSKLYDYIKKFEAKGLISLVG